MSWRVLCGLSVLVLAGCQSPGWSERWSAGYSAPPILTGQDGESKSALEEMRRVVTSGEKPLLSEVCLQGSEKNGSGECKLERNRAVATLMLLSEEACLKHRRSIYGNDAVINSTLGTLTNLFAGTAAVVNPVTSKSIFSALALFANSERSLFNEVVYKQMLVPAIDGKIVQSRQSDAGTIWASFSKEVQDYPVAQGIYDVSVFHSKCSFMDGLRLALQEGSQSSSAQRRANLKVELSEVELKLALEKRAQRQDAKVVRQLEQRRQQLQNEIDQTLGLAVANNPDASAAK